MANTLRRIYPNLVVGFNAAWQAFSDESQQDRYRQSVHSMREVLSRLLDMLAPIEEVKTAEWFEPETDTGRPTWRQKTQYAILGKSSKSNLDELALNPIFVVMKETKKVYDDLCNIAHTRDEASASVLAETYLHNCQILMEKIIGLRETYAGKVQKE